MLTVAETKLVASLRVEGKQTHMLCEPAYEHELVFFCTMLNIVVTPSHKAPTCRH